jgi:hypothetical protein
MFALYIHIKRKIRGRRDGRQEENPTCCMLLSPLNEIKIHQNISGCLVFGAKLT